MFDINEILEPDDFDDVLELLNKRDDLNIIAGGTDILIKLHHNKINNIKLLSIRKIRDLNKINLLSDGTISIGAMTTFTQIIRDKIINKHIPLLAKAAASMGGPQIRSMATIGGNICNGAVSADSAPSLFALNAQLKFKSINGERIIPILDFYEGPGKVHINKDEILAEILIKKDDYYNKKGEYIKFANRKALDISMLGVCIVSEVKEKRIIDMRISLGVAASTPIRCFESEKYSIGKELNKESIDVISNLALKDSNPRDSWRASKDYRLHLIKTLIKRNLEALLLEGE